MNARIARLFAVGMLWVLLALVPAATRGAAEPSGVVPVVVHLGPGSVLWLEGTSTLHSFESRTSDITLAITLDSTAAASPSVETLVSLARASAIRAVDVTLPVTSLKSDKAGLDRNLWKTLNASEHKTISVHLDRLTLPAGGATGDTIALDAEGSIAVAGAQRPIRLAARMIPSSAGLWLEGVHELRMTEFDIKPPTMMLGAVRVGDQVTIHYRLLLSSGRAGSAPSSSDH